MWIDDQILIEARLPYFGKYWVPDAPLVVLGRSNIASVECSLEACAKDGVTITQRSGGGGAVVLFPGCAIISCGLWVQRPYHNDLYFRLINQSVIEVLTSAFPSLVGLEHSGISDVSLNGKKCAGTSMFRSRNYLLYQASLLVDCDIELIERYLLHPSREPDYRKNRSHREFLFGLSEICPDLRAATVVEVLKLEFEKILRRHLSGELIDPPFNQTEYIRAKAESFEAAKPD